MSKIKYCCVCEKDVVKGSYIRIGKHCLCKSCEAQIIEDAKSLIDPNIMEEMGKPNEPNLRQLAWIIEEFVSEEMTYGMMCFAVFSAMIWNYMRNTNLALSFAIDKLNELQEIIDSK